MSGWAGVSRSPARWAGGVALVVLAGCVGPSPNGAAPDRSAPGGPGELSGTVVLLDGSGLDGWAQAGPGRFRIEAGGAVQSEGGLGLLWYTGRTFADFVLDLDWRVTAGTDNSGVFVRFPDPGDDPWVAVRRGYEIQINDNPAGDPQKTGAVYGLQQPLASASRAVGEWNHYTIRAVGAEYTVWLNGVRVNRFVGTDPARGHTGHIGLQNHDPGSAVQFRDVRVRAP